jgi:hypothetical protein
MHAKTGYVVLQRCEVVSDDEINGGGADTPEQAVETLFRATKREDLDAILASFAPDMREMFEEMMEVMGKDKLQEQIGGGTEELGALRILSTKIEDDWAEVETSVTVDGQEQQDIVKVHKIDGAWYVDMPEEDKKGMKEAVKMLKDPKTNKMEEMQKNVPGPERE